MARFIYTLRDLTAHRLARETGAFHATSGASTMEVHRRLEEGQDVVGSMAAFSVGLRLPEGASIEFHEECPTDGPLRAQCEGRRKALPLQEKGTRPFWTIPEDDPFEDADPGLLVYVETGTFSKVECLR